MDFSHLHGAACRLYTEAITFKLPEFWSYEVFTGWQKTTADLSFFLEENSANVPWSGWDEEITKQTGGFTSDQNLLTGAKQKQKLQQRPDEKKKTWASFKS